MCRVSTVQDGSMKRFYASLFIQLLQRGLKLDNPFDGCAVTNKMQKMTCKIASCCDLWAYLNP